MIIHAKQKTKKEARKMPPVYTKTSLTRRMGNLYLLTLLPIKTHGYAQKKRYSPTALTGT